MINGKRRRFLKGLAAPVAMLPLARFASSLTCGMTLPEKSTDSSRVAKGNPVRWPILSGSPVLDSLHPVIENSRDVSTNLQKIIEVAGWMGYEELPLPEFTLPFGVGAGDGNDAIDFILIADSIERRLLIFPPTKSFKWILAGSTGRIRKLNLRASSGPWTRVFRFWTVNFYRELTSARTGEDFRGQHQDADAGRKA